MRILLISFAVFASSLFANIEEKKVSDLMKKYELVMNEQKLELIPQVFTSKFLQESGGLEKLKANLSAKSKQKFSMNSKFSLKKGNKSDTFYLNPNPNEDIEFILKTENGMIKIDGTINHEE